MLSEHWAPTAGEDFSKKKKKKGFYKIVRCLIGITFGAACSIVLILQLQNQQLQNCLPKDLLANDHLL